MSLLSQLTEEDKTKIVNYIEIFSEVTDYSNERDVEAPIDHILRFWDTNKTNLFGQIFNNDKLRISKEVTIFKDEDMLDREIGKLTDENIFIRNYISWITRESEKYLVNDNNISAYRFVMYDLIDNHALIQNKFLGNNSISITLPSTGKVYKIQKGCKLMKALGVIAKEFNIPGFEQFRLEHSVILNEKKLKGTLTLSVHPLDFLTMSDNDCDWDSCMSWMNRGDYRMGTVEMMNSPCVVEAYLESSTPMRLYKGYYPGEWTNKKWRELFIVTPECVAGIKGYPYWNVELETIVINWIADLMQQYNGFEYDEEIRKFENYMPILDGKKVVKFGFTSDLMYNDIDRAEHLIRVGKNVAEGDDIEINFSGPTECMICGSRIDNYDHQLVDPMFIVCSACENVVKCDRCESLMYDGNYCEVDGERICYDCYDNETSNCSVCGEVHLNDRMTWAVLSIEGYAFDDDTRVELIVCDDCMTDVKTTFDSASFFENWKGKVSLFNIANVTLKNLQEYAKNNPYFDFDMWVKEFIRRHRNDEYVYNLSTGGLEPLNEDKLRELVYNSIEI